MSKKIYTINTVSNYKEIIYDPFVCPFLNDHKDYEVYSITDPTLLSDMRKNGGVTSDITRRVLNYAKDAENKGADGILVTCTSLNQATESIQSLLNIPIISIEEPVAEMTVKNGKKIGILATLSTSPIAFSKVIEMKAKEEGKEIEIITRIVEGAYDSLCSGDKKRHDEMVCEALYKLAKEVDCIAFAQLSMSLLQHETVGVPIYKIRSSGFERIYELIEKRR